MARHGCLDEVTGLPKRESMLSYLRGQLNLLGAHGLPFSTALIQLDRNGRGAAHRIAGIGGQFIFQQRKR